MIKFYKEVRCKGDWELHFMLGKFQFRIARSQFASWWNCEPLFDFRYGYNNRECPPCP
jgi:hypothetical protein